MSYARHFIAVAATVLSCALPATARATCADDYLGEVCTYEFDLYEGKSESVCKHMSGILNGKFTRFLDLRGFSERQESWREGQPPMFLVYPNSKEFEAVPWQYPLIFTDHGTRYRLPVAQVDIDNDGKDETVIQSVFNGDGRTPEELLIYRKGEFDLTHITSRRELFVGQDDKHNHPSFLTNGLRVRLFQFEGVTYLLEYRADASEPKNSRWIVDQEMRIVKYLGGGKRSLGDQDPTRTEEICAFRMRRLQEQ